MAGRLVLLVLWAAGSGMCWQLSSLQCSLYPSSSCECGFQPSLDALECDLARNLFGQHLAQELVVKALREFVETDYPSKPLVLSFHGWSGTGKTFLSSLMVKHLYRDGIRSPYVHHFSPILDFPHAQNLDQYKENLKQWIQGNLTACGRSLFLFEEMDKMHPGLIDVIVPFLGPSWVVFGSNYKKAIFIFISNSGGDDINRVALKFWRERRDREEIQLSDVGPAIANAVISDREHGFWRSEIIKQNLIDFIVPFLPLRPNHVRQCVRSELVQQRLANERDIVQSVADSLVYIPEAEKVFSSTGCKTIPSRINYYL
ncbi:PREDICTED: prosalusin [Nanorana parkeri]|uniref:prosalusin n=1 Tax=Nanorana parkeri TaxID=125878 RepID=UPI000854471A|nr:PREDICTED: prosalusin [Nanorana parkeri]